MTSRAQHYREAERLLSESEGPSWANTPTPWSPRPRSAPPRATLATISDDAYNEYLDLRSLKETREGWPGRRRRRAVTGSRTTTNERPRTQASSDYPACGGRGKSSQGAARARAQALKAQVSAATSRYVALCRAAGIPVRDIAFLLGITPQRVSQIGLKDDDD